VGWSSLPSHTNSFRGSSCESSTVSIHAADVEGSATDCECFSRPAEFRQKSYRKLHKEEYSSETTKALPLRLAAGPNPDENWRFILNSNNQTGEAFS
jgi:hypothetical protein